MTKRLNYKRLATKSAAMAFGLAALAACGGGGGGGVATNVPTPPASGGNNTGGSNTGGITTPPSTTNVTITAPGAGSLGGNSANLAAGPVPNFTILGPSPGTAMTFRQSAVKIAEFSVVDANAGGATFTIASPNGSTILLSGELKIPNLSVTIPVFAVAPNGGTSGGQPNGGGTFNADFGALNYTLLGRWDYAPQGQSSTFLGYALGGFQSPSAGLPVSGTATYTGSAAGSPPAGGARPTINTAGGAVGTLYAPALGGGVDTPKRLAGDASIAVNFSSGTVSGSLTNMKFDGGSAAWNDVNLTGNLSGATLSGTASTNGPPAAAGRYGFASNATGRFDGALYGPNAEEIGAIWSMHDPSGMSVLGGFAAKK